MGRFPEADGIRARPSETGRCRPGRFPEPEPDRDGCLRSSHKQWSNAPGNVLLPARSTGLAKDSVANVSQVVALDKTLLSEHVGRLSRSQLGLVLSGIDVVLGR